MGQRLELRMQDPFVKGSSIQWGVRLYKICLFFAWVKWVASIKFSRPIFAWKKVKCSIYATFQKWSGNIEAVEFSGCHNGSNGGWQPMWITDSRGSRRVSLKLGRTWDFGSSRCPITAFMDKSARIRRRQKLINLSTCKRKESNLY